MDTYQDAQDYLSKGVRGKKWYISLATVFAHLPEGDARIAFVQEFISDTHFGKAFLANYQLNASYRMNSDNGKTSLETELESYDAFVKSLNPDVDKMEAIATLFRQEMNGNSSEILLIHLFLCQVVQDLCQGKVHIIILERAESLLKNGFAEEAFRALEYIDSKWIESIVRWAKQDAEFEWKVSWKEIYRSEYDSNNVQSYTKTIMTMVLWIENPTVWTEVEAGSLWVWVITDIQKDSDGYDVYIVDFNDPKTYSELSYSLKVVSIEKD